MKLRRSLIFFALALAGLPLAAQEAALFGKAVPLPWNLGAAHELLLAGKWKRARDLAQQELPVLAGDFDTNPASAATGLALLAVAEAGAGDRDTALCHWNAAKKLSEKLVEADLSLYGKPGVFLRDTVQDESKPSVDFDEVKKKLETEGEDPRIVRPQIAKGWTQPQYTYAARQARVQGRVIIESIIGENGRLSNARILENLPKGLGVQALEAVCHWQFKPARLEGKTVKVYYALVVNFGIAPPSKSQNP
jgi:TonB family protein